MEGDGKLSHSSILHCNCFGLPVGTAVPRNNKINKEVE
jgi:hypothetical protein